MAPLSKATKERELLPVLAALCRWSNVDPEDLGPTNADGQAKYAYARLAMFLASQLLPAFRALLPSNAGRPRVNKDKSSPIYGLPIEPPVAEWLVGGVDKQRDRARARGDRLSPLAACKRLKDGRFGPPCPTDYTTKTAAATMVSHYRAARKRRNALMSMAETVRK